MRIRFNVNRVCWNKSIPFSTVGSSIISLLVTDSFCPYSFNRLSRSLLLHSLKKHQKRGFYRFVEGMLRVLQLDFNFLSVIVQHIFYIFEWFRLIRQGFELNVQSWWNFCFIMRVNPQCDQQYKTYEKNCLLQYLINKIHVVAYKSTYVPHKQKQNLMMIA